MAAPLRIGRYLLFDSFAKGGMASVHFGRVLGPVGFSRIVAIKRHHSQFAKEPEFVSMIIDEARLAGRIRHPNVVPVIDVVQLPDELLLVMEYVAGVSLARLARAAATRGEQIPIPVAAAIACDVLSGLHAAHVAKNERGEPLGIVHRDVSPQNVLLGADGLARVTDFGIAHAVERVAVTRTHDIKGKLEYMAKEQLRRERVDRRADVYASGIVLWEMLTGARPFAEDDQKALLNRVFSGDFLAPSRLRPEVPPELDAVTLTALCPDATGRFESALAMAQAVSRAAPRASHIEVGEWVSATVADELAARERRVAEIEAFRQAGDKNKSERTLTEEVAVPADDGPTVVLPPELVEDTGSTTTTRSMQRGSVPSLPGQTEEPAPMLANDPTRVAETTLAPTRESNAEPGAATDTRVHAVRSLPPSAPRSRDRFVVLLPVGAAVLGVVVIIAVALGHRSRSASQPDVTPLDSSTPLLARSNAPTPTALASPLPSATPAASASPLPAETADARASSAPRSAPPPRGRPPRPASKPPPAPRPNCNPPYTVDSEGVRVPKPECFKK
jgi:serine/threonine protein kinase